MRKINIAIDGHSGCGKSSTAKEVAKQLGYTYLDTGAMYRAVTYSIQTYNINYHNDSLLNDHLNSIIIGYDSSDGHITLNGENVEEKIRSLEVANKVSEISAIDSVRKKLVEFQQEIARKKGVVMDGRDIGTVVLPNAELKVFMTAALEVRALRRQKELQDKGIDERYEEILINLKERDHQDSNRKISPLKKAKDAILIDTSNLTFKNQVSEIIAYAKKILENS